MPDDNTNPNIAPPDIPPPQADLAALQAVTQNQGPAQQQRPGATLGQPNIVQLLSQLIRPTAGQGGTGPINPQAQPQAPSRLHAFESFLGTFVTSLAEGMRASGTGPGANIRGAGAAMMAPRELGIQQQQLQMQQQQVQSQEALRQAQEEFNRQRATAFDLTPMQVTGADGRPTTIMVPRSEMGRIQSAIERGQATEKSAQTRATGSANIQTQRGQSIREQLANKVTIQSMKDKAAADRLDKQLAGAKNVAEIRAAAAEYGARARNELQNLRLTQPTAATRTMGEQAQNLLPHVDELRQQINALDAKGKLGPIAGRFNDFMAGKVGAGDADYAQFRTTIGLMQTGMMRAHVGARGGQQLLSKFESLLNGAKMDKPTLLGSLAGMESFLKTYAQSASPEMKFGAQPTGLTAEDMLKKYPPKK